ncbi:hypothetical protein NUW54_g13012 [Trametes sanguinea]|uniref:Uncharacterized protein n=1 Tax=Trametes sanguinea TaxID=158606 RepID=A0ACC1MQE5_9APHY|nr:hypothetical protein NUW54_g13012 [Trametes sanguinea]
MAASLSQLSACVTRILSLTGFSKELKTRDIQAAFSEWDNVNGGFKIKWINDTSLLIVFNDATVAKRAYLHALAFPPSIFTSPNTSTVVTIKPYDGPDAQDIIQSVNSRQHNNSATTTATATHPAAASRRMESATEERIADIEQQIAATQRHLEERQAALSTLSPVQNPDSDPPVQSEGATSILPADVCHKIPLHDDVARVMPYHGRDA